MRPRSLFRILIIGLAAASSAAQVRAAPVADGRSMRNFVLTSERIGSFGKFTAIEEAFVRPGGALHVYGEPGDFGWHRQGEGAKFNVTVNAQLRRSNGRAVAGSVSPLVLKHQAADPTREFFFSLSLNISAPVGLYTIDVTLRDPANGRTIRKTFPVRVSYRPQPPLTQSPSGPAQESDAATPDRTKAEPNKCKKYFGQIGAMIDVPCRH